MKKVLVLVLFAALTLTAGCSSNLGSAGLGAVGGAAVGAGGYEYHLKRQKDRVEQEYKDGKIDQAEYEIRMDQIKRDSFLQK